MREYDRKLMSSNQSCINFEINHYLPQIDISLHYSRDYTPVNMSMGNIPLWKSENYFYFERNLTHSPESTVYEIFRLHVIYTVLQTHDLLPFPLIFFQFYGLYFSWKIIIY